MFEIIKIASIVLAVYFILMSFKKPIALFFVYIIFESYFFQTIDLYSLPIKLIPKITLYLDDLVKIVILFLVIRNWEKLGQLKYKWLIIILIFSFIILTFLRIAAHFESLNINALKTQLRLYSILFLPLFFYLFLPEKDKKFFIRGSIIIVLFSLAIFYLEYFTDYEKVLHYGLYEQRYYLETGVERISIVNSKLLMGLTSLFLIYFFKENNKIYLFIWFAILFTFLLSTYRASFLVVLLNSFIVVFFVFTKQTKSNLKFRFIILLVTIIAVTIIISTGILDLYIERVNTAFTDLKHDEGSANIRIFKSYLVIQQLNDNTLIFLLGSILSKTAVYLSELIALDLGILDTIAINGIIFTLIFISMLFSIYRNLDSKILSSIPVKSLMLSAIPTLIFNFELILFTAGSIIPIYSYYLAELKWSKEKLLKSIGNNFDKKII